MSDEVPSRYDPLICGWSPYPPRKSKRWQLRAEQTERILTDLIAELRVWVDDYDYEGIAAEDTAEAIYRAEARLREITND